MNDATNRPVALITGAGRGIGRVVARRYAEGGYRLVLAGRHAETLDATAEGLESPSDVAVCVADVSTEHGCGELAAAALDAMGRIDVLVHNAAATGTDQTVASMEPDNWNVTLATNLTGPMMLSREVLRTAMLPAGEGSIQFFSSAAAKQIVPRKAHYSVSKLALIALAQTIAREVGAAGIRSNTIVIGTVGGDRVEAYFERLAAEDGVTAAEIEQRFTGDVALHRLLRPEEIADVSFWLASDAASAITGQAINVTGGGVMW